MLSTVVFHCICYIEMAQVFPRKKPIEIAMEWLLKDEDVRHWQIGRTGAKSRSLFLTIDTQHSLHQIVT
jgi:hypothetical protein